MIPYSSLQTIAHHLRSGQWPLLAYLDWLETQVTEREERLQTLVPEDGRFDRLRRQAQLLLEQYPHPTERPPLFGVPIGVKDIFHVAGFTTRAGSQLPPELWADAPEAASVTALRQAGALILGKTVTTEFAYFGPGPTRNPHNPEHTPGGSSSGSAAAVAAGFSPLTLGTQTIGSVNRPAAFCGIVGYKPSYDRISREGVIPLAPSLDHVGLFVPQAGDLDLPASLLCHQWQSVVMLKRPVLGIPDGPYLSRASKEGLAHFQTTCARLMEANFTVKLVPSFRNFDELYERHYALVAAEAAQVHAQWFAAYEELYHPRTAELIQTGQKIKPRQVARAQSSRLRLRQELTRLMDSHMIDLWITPAVMGGAPLGLERTGDPVMNLPWTQAGLPSVSLPSGRNEEGLPLGLQAIGKWYNDEALIGWSVELAQALQNQ